MALVDLSTVHSYLYGEGGPNVCISVLNLCGRYPFYKKCPHKAKVPVSIPCEVLVLRRWASQGVPNRSYIAFLHVGTWVLSPQGKPAS